MALEYAHTYDDLLALLEQATPYTAGSDTSSLATPHQAVLKNLGIIVLGELEGTSTIIAFSQAHVKRVEIRAIDRMKMANVIQWFGEEMEQKIWSGGGDMPAGFLYTLSQLRHAIAAEGGKKQLTNADLKGGGVWEVNSRLLLVGDHELATYNGSFQHSTVPVVEGAMIDFGSCEKWYDHEQLEKYLTQAKSQQWREGVVNELIDLFARWENWENQYDAHLMAALTLCTWLQTVWDWRPCLFVTGPTASGKSTLLEDTLPRLFGKLSLFSQKSTMAGLMQSIGQTARIAILDEFESGRERRDILQLMRTSGKGGKFFRGTPSQKANTYGLRHIVWMGAIETGLRDAADRNRYILLNLKGVTKHKGDEMLQLPPVGELEDLGQRSLAVAVASWKDVRARAKVLRDTIVEGVDHRIVESYSLPCAMLGVTLGVDEGATVGMMLEVLKGRDLIEQQTSDEQRLVETIFSKIIFPGGGRQFAISELVFDGEGEGTEGVGTEHFRTAARYGITTHNEKDESGYMTGKEFVFFEPNIIESELLKGTKYEGSNIGEILLRIPGAKRSRQRLASKRPYGISVPKESITKMLGREKDDQTGGFYDTSVPEQGSFLK